MNINLGWTALRSVRVAHAVASFESLESRRLMAADAHMRVDVASADYLAAPSPAAIFATSRVSAKKTTAVAPTSASTTPATNTPVVTTPALPNTVTSPNTPANFFMVGVWSQPTNLLSFWKSAGVNTAVGYESQGGSVSLTQWNRSAASNSLFTIRPASSNPSQDSSDKNLLAWMFADEPDLHQVNPKTQAAQYAALKKINPNIPIFLNYSGGKVIGWAGSVSPSDYTSYLAATDWVGSDIYPVTGWNRLQNLDASGQVVARLSSWSGGKPEIAVIETSNQRLPYVPAGTPGVTAGQFRAEVWAAINRGAKGIVYFPQQIGAGFQYNATPTAVLNEMKVQNARLQSLGAVLQSTFNPAGLGLTIPNSLQGSWRSYGGKNYFIVTNISSTAITSATISFKGVTAGALAVAVNGENRSVAATNGAITDSFAPYETHIYVA